MIRYGQDISTGSEICTQVCIVGSGAAGITLAWHLDQAGIDVIIIDGSRDYDQYLDIDCYQTNGYKKYLDKELLYNGESVGLFTNNEPHFLTLPNCKYNEGAWERERYLGGTTLHWGGQSRPLDHITFEGYGAYTGWPINKYDLDPYYVMAADFCLLHGANFTNDYWVNTLNLKAPQDIPDLPNFNVEMYQFIGSSNLNFATKEVGGQTLESSTIDVIRNATLLNIEHQSGTVNTLSVASMTTGDLPNVATKFCIKAKAYVLAMGAVANARQLLLSKAANSSGNVGRYFMCHPLSAGAINTSGNYLTTGQSNLMSGNKSNGSKWSDNNGVKVEGRFIPTAETAKSLGIGRCWFWERYSSYYFEQAPNPKSCITLSETVDPVFGQAQTKINWQLCDLDENTYVQTTAMFQKDVDNLGGKVTFQPWEYVKKNAKVNGHHLGTTRMSKNPEDGVVNENMRTHDIDNLYVTGSSVWPCAGISNPTFTIIALSIRLADHLKAQI